MSVVLPINEDPRFRLYTATTGQTQFAVPFPFQQNDDVFVAVEQENGSLVEIDRTLYTLIGANDPQGGMVTLNTGRTEGDVIFVLGRAILDRLTSIVSQGRFSSHLTDGEFDRVRIIQQEQSRDLKRAVSVPFGQDGLEIDKDLGDGDTLMKQGDRLVKGANAQDITQAQGYAAAAKQDAEKSEDAAGAAAQSVGVVENIIANLEVKDFASVAAAAAATFPAIPQFIRTAGFTSAGDGGGGLYSDPVEEEPATAPKFFNTNVNRWFAGAETVVDIMRFGAQRDGAGSGAISANNAAFADAKEWLHGRLVGGVAKPELHVGPGIYDYDVFPDFAAPYASVIGKGEARLRYHGTEDAVVLGTDSTSNRHVTFGPFLIEAPPTAKNGLVVQGCHFSKVSANVRGAGTTYAGILTKWNVCTEFWVACSVNDGSWYLGGKPAKGIVLDQRQAAHETAYCTFYNVCAEGLDLGIVLENALGNVFLGGTSEGIATTAIQIKANSRRNRFYGLDCEANDLLDIYCLGWENEFIGMDCEKTTTFDGAAAYGNKIIGGNHNRITFGTTTANNYVGGGVQTNRVAPGGISDPNNLNSYGETYDRLNDRWGKGPRSSTAIPVGASPFTWTNNSPNMVMVVIAGGTLANVQQNIEGVGVSNSTQSGGRYVRPGDGLTVSYSAAPTMRVVRG